MTLGIVDGVTQGLLDTEQLVEVLFQGIKIGLTVQLNAGRIQTGGVTELENTVVLRDLLAFRVLGSLRLILITVQICHTVHAGQGSLTKDEELVTVLIHRQQAGRRRHICGHIFQTVDLSEFFFLIFSLLQRHKHFVPDSGAYLNLLDMSLDIIQGCRNLVEHLEGLLAADLSADIVAVRQLLFGHQTNLCSTNCTSMFCHDFSS